LGIPGLDRAYTASRFPRSCSGSVAGPGVWPDHRDRIFCFFHSLADARVDRGLASRGPDGIGLHHGVRVARVSRDEVPETRFF